MCGEEIWLPIHESGHAGEGGIDEERKKDLSTILSLEGYAQEELALSPTPPQGRDPEAKFKPFSLSASLPGSCQTEP